MTSRLVLSFALVALVACGHDEGVVLREWTLEVDGRPPVALRLPAHIHEQVAGATSFRLVAAVALPPELRERPLTLTVVSWGAGATRRLRAGGHEATVLDPDSAANYRDASWRVPASVGPSLRLELETERSRVSPHWAWIDDPPRLSATPRGDARFLAIRWFNACSPILALGFFAGLLFTYAISFVLDPRRTGNGWFAGQALGAGGMILSQHSWGYALWGSLYGAFANVAVAGTGVCAAYFTHAHFELGPPPRVVRAAWWVVVAIALYSLEPRRAVQAGLAASELLLLACMAYCCVHLVRRLRSAAARFDAALLLAAWSFTVALAVPDSLAYLGLGTLTPYLLSHVGLVGYGFFQMFALSRDRVLAFRRVDSLNQELRHQVAQRSRELASALARLAGHARSHPLVSGDRVADRYVVVKWLGAGATGAVYEVERSTDGRRLALKLLAGAGDRERWVRLAREAELVAEVDHQNVVGIHDVGLDDEHGVYVVMELVDGRSLEALRDRFGDAAWARPLLRQIAAGLAAIHARGLVHRDLKPANVLVAGRPSSAKIADFGLAAIVAARDDQAFADTAVEGGLTRTGVVMGTPFYMAPELATGAKDARPPVDVFAFGVLAYELLTGARPFEGGHGLVRARGTLPPPPAAVGAPLAALLERCLARDPAQRPSARELVEALE